jgi:hypothetical protein
MPRFAVLAFVLASFASAATADTAPAGNDYSNAANWLCLPGHEDACSASQDTTVVAADGTLRTEKFKPAKNAPVDCFYVYPTVSRDPSVNSDMLPGAEEMGVVAQQFARFGAACTRYAPLYRQFTLTALAARMTGRPMAAPADPLLAYHDVVDAWNYYLAHYNHGRGVVLIGHSQGSGMLIQLIKNEIDGKPIQKQLVLAILGGTRLQVPVGKDVGGDFQHVPLCHSTTQVGCVIAFASFRANLPPPANSRFGKSNGPGLEAACVNPAALGGGSGEVHAYLASAGRGLGNSLEPKPWATDKSVVTPYVSVPGMLTAECAHNEVGNYLAITVHGDPTDARVDDITGDVVIGGQVQQDWGLHLIDMNLFMGNMVDIVKAESRAYRKQH